LAILRNLAIVLVGLGALVGVGVAGYFYHEKVRADQKIDLLQANISTLAEKIDNLTSDKGRANFASTTGDIEGKLDNLVREIDDIKNEIEEINAHTSSTDTNIDEMEDSVRKIKNAIDDIEAKIVY
jgi:uncharacterized coiled-coil DUF342 family protein